MWTIYNFFLIAFSLTFPSGLFIILSPFSIIVDIQMYHRARFIAAFSAAFLPNPTLLWLHLAYHRALFITEFSATFLSNLAFLWLYLNYRKHNISHRVNYSISDLIWRSWWKYKHPRVFAHVGRHLLACLHINRINILVFCLFTLYGWETHSSSIDAPQQPDRATPASLSSHCRS